MSEKENIEDAHKVFDKLQHPLLQIESLSLTFHGHDLIVDSELELNFGRRYGLLGLNGCGKSTLLSAIGCCELPIPERMDIFHLTREIEASDLSALEALVSCDVERLKLGKEVEAFGWTAIEEPLVDWDACFLFNRIRKSALRKSAFTRKYWAIPTPVVWLYNQVPALEREMLKRIKEQGLDLTPRILIVTRLLPDAVGNTCGEWFEKVFGAEHSHN